MSLSSLFNLNKNKKNEQGLTTNPDLVPYSHNPPGHTCGLPCCNRDLQIQLRANKPPRSCIGIQDHDHDAVSQNFTFKGRLKQSPGLENGFFSIQEARDTSHAPIPTFGTVRRDLPVVTEDNKVIYPFLKGREITLPESSDPYVTEKLYLEGFNFGESDDFQHCDISTSDSGIVYDGDIETMKVNDTDYYVAVKNPTSNQKGVPYDPKVLENMKTYTWDLVKDFKDDLSSKSQKEKDDYTCSSTSDYYSSGSNYYEVLQLPDEKSLLGKEHDSNPQDGKCDPTLAEFRDKSKSLPNLALVPPKPPVQTRYNHPPLPKTDKTSPSEPDDKVFDLPTNQQSLTSDTDSTCTKYHTYNSVYSITSMANQMSKEVYERFVAQNRADLAKKPVHRDVRDFSFTGDDLPLTNKTLDWAVNKTRFNPSLKERKSASLPRQITQIKEAEEENAVVSEKETGKTDVNTVPSDFSDCNKLSIDLSKSLNDIHDIASDSEDETDGILNPGFRIVNVDGKFLGSQYSLDRVNSFNEELQDRFLHLWDEDEHEEVKEDEKKVLELLKERLRDIDDSEGASGESFNDNPVTLIL